MSKEAKPARGAHICVQRLTLRARWKVDPVERGVISTEEELLRSMIPRNPRLRSHPARSQTVCELLYSKSPLIDPPDNVENSAIPDQLQEVPSSNQRELNTTDGNRFERWRATASATAKLFLRGTMESADAFPPLKSVVGGLCFILDNWEVWLPSSIPCPRCL